MRSLVTQIQLPLHRQFWVCELPFRLFLVTHGLFPRTNKVKTTLVAFKSGDKRSANIREKNSQVFESQWIMSGHFKLYRPTQSNCHIV
jgi:hypothetical protein